MNKLDDYIKLAESRDFSADAFDKMRVAIPAMAKALIEAEEALIEFKNAQDNVFKLGVARMNAAQALETIKKLKENEK